MMRLAGIILGLIVIAVTLVHLRRQETLVRHEIQRLQTQEITLRRTLWQQQVRLGELTAPEEVRKRADEMVFGRPREENHRQANLAPTE